MGYSNITEKRCKKEDEYWHSDYRTLEEMRDMCDIDPECKGVYSSECKAEKGDMKSLCKGEPEINFNKSRACFFHKRK